MRVVVIKAKGKPVEVVQVRNMSTLEFLKLEKECESNLGELYADYEKVKCDLQDAFKEIEQLKAEIKFLKGE